jgi:hypothetical protein
MHFRSPLKPTAANHGIASTETCEPNSLIDWPAQNFRKSAYDQSRPVKRLVFSDCWSSGMAQCDAQSIQAVGAKTPSPPSGRSEPIAISSRPSSPASKARTVAGSTRTTSQQRRLRVSSSSLT